MDGYSRFVHWLRVAHSNKLPEVTLSLFVNAVENNNVLPDLTRTDHGTENGLLAELQCAFKGDGAHISGPSMGNQRIERFWRDVRQGGIQFWMTLFNSLDSTFLVRLSNKT